MEVFAARISLRRLAQTYTGVKEPRDYGFEDLTTLIQDTVSQTITADSELEQRYKTRLEVIERYITTSGGFEIDLIEGVLLDTFMDELEDVTTNALEAFVHYTYMCCKIKNLFR